MAKVPTWRAAMSVLMVAVALVGCSNGSTTSGSVAEPDSETASSGSETTTADATAVTADTSPDTGVDDSASTVPAGGRLPEGFTTVTARITEADGQVCEVCVWLADTSDERGRGLMGVTDLGGAAGMVFRFDEPFVGSFYMFQTPTPLSIAWFAPDGRHVGSADMAPCLDTPAGECPLYSPGVEYDLALEVFEGGLDDLAVGPGSRLELIDGTEAEGCPLAADTTG
jgi:uncharacterized membrane protein (UPF0127 family)